MTDEHRRMTRDIPTDWLKGANIDADGKVGGPPFNDDEAEAAWWVFSQVRDTLKAMGATDHPRDPLRACLWAACQWARINLEAEAMMRQRGENGSTH